MNESTKNGVYPIMVTYEYHINEQDQISFVDNQWLRFARDNAAWHLTEQNILGQPIWSFISNKETEMIYQIIVNKVRKHDLEIKLPFRCDSPNIRRHMELHISPLKDNNVKFLSNLLEEEPQNYTPLLDPRVERAASFIIMCSWCKKVQTSEEDWVEVESAIKKLNLFGSFKLPKLSHGICPDCMSQIKSEIVEYTKEYTPTIPQMAFQG